MNKIYEEFLYNVFDISYKRSCIIYAIQNANRYGYKILSYKVIGNINGLNRIQIAFEVDGHKKIISMTKTRYKQLKMKKFATNVAN